MAVEFPNPRNCAELVMHVWLYYKGNESYRCQRCDYKLSKNSLKEATDSA